MIAIIFCIVAFAASLWAGRRSLGMGLSMLLLFGYFYGILRANLLTTASHFIFDCGLIGLYLSQSWLAPGSKEAKRTEAVRLWSLLLMGWCVLLLFVPFQPWLVSLVGFRGNTFFVPALILGARLKEKDLLQLSGAFAILNLISLGFGFTEYVTGIQRFYPVSTVTQIIYSSADVAGGFYRIPAIFSSAHAYGGTMVDSLPFLIGAWSRTANRRFQLLLLAGAAAGLMGILLSATRVNFVIGTVMMVVAICVGQGSRKNKIVLLLLIAAIGLTALGNSRFQRFKSLSDTSYVEDRIAGSVNRGFFEILVEYPMGNGLGGGGTSMPYFLAGQVKNPIGMENEYGRILCEQGVIGLTLWIGFALWFVFSAPIAFQPSPWGSCRRMVWCLLAFMMASMVVGVGFLTAIPGSLIQLLGIGWVATRPAPEANPGVALRTALVRRIGRRQGSLVQEGAKA
jgi:hypothetical protein